MCVRVCVCTGKEEEKHLGGLLCQVPSRNAPLCFSGRTCESPGLLLAGSANRPGLCGMLRQGFLNRGGLTVANCTPARTCTETVSDSALEIRTMGYRTPHEKGSLSPRPLHFLRDTTSDPLTRSDSAFLPCTSSWQTLWLRFSHKKENVRGRCEDLIKWHMWEKAVLNCYAYESNNITCNRKSHKPQRKRWEMKRRTPTCRYIYQCTCDLAGGFPIWLTDPNSWDGT